jgi:hypothetical protein
MREQDLVTGPRFATLCDRRARRLRWQVTHPDVDHPQREPSDRVPAVAVVDLVETGEVGLDCVLMLAEETQQAGYSPALVSPIRFAYASNRAL